MSTPDRLWTLGVSGLLALGVPGGRVHAGCVEGTTIVGGWPG